MTHILFVNPPLSLIERYGVLAPGGSSAPPLGLACLAANLIRHGHQASILDVSALGLSYSSAVQRILDSGADIVGYTASTVSIHSTFRLARMVHDTSPNLYQILGGPHITSVPMETMDICPIFTAGVIGEGEEIILDLVNALETHQELDNIQGLIFSRNGARELTTRRPFIKDLDTLPYPAWHLLPPLDRFYRPPIFSVKQLPSTSLITSRGCSGRCTFCDRTVFGNSCRAFSAEYVVGMMTHLYQQYSIRDILIDDDNFMLFRNRLIKICRMLQAEKKPLTWSCNARVDFVDPETLNEMKKARCWQIAFGIETGSQEILDVLKKDITLEQIERSLRWTKEAGIQTKGFFMIGHPLETEKTLRKTVQFSLRTPLDDFQISYFTPLPGSEIFKGASRYGKLDRDWRKMNMWQVVFIAYGLTPETLDYYARFAFRKFYLRPRIILSYIRKSRHVVHWLALFRAGLSLLHFIFLKPNNPTTTLTEK